MSGEGTWYAELEVSKLGKLEPQSAESGLGSSG